MSDIVVDAGKRLAGIGTATLPCAIGRGGACAAAAKREGDGRTPLGRWPVRGVLLRPDRAPPRVGLHLPWRWLRPDDGWSDDPADPAYNRPVRHSHRFSAERMWRTDGLYDVVIVLGYNDAPAVRALGSAIFVHPWRDRAATEGCVALAPDMLARLLVQLRAGDAVHIG